MARHVTGGKERLILIVDKKVENYLSCYRYRFWSYITVNVPLRTTFDLTENLITFYRVDRFFCFLSKIEDNEALDMTCVLVFRFSIPVESYS